MVVDGLHLHLKPATLSAVIAFCLGWPGDSHRPALKPALNVDQPVEIFTGRRKVILTEEIARRLDLPISDGRAAMDPLLQCFHQFPDLPFVFFGSHFGLMHRSPIQTGDKCAFECTPKKTHDQMVPAGFPGGWGKTSGEFEMDFHQAAVAGAFESEQNQFDLRFGGDGIGTTADDCRRGERTGSAGITQP